MEQEIRENGKLIGKVFSAGNKVFWKDLRHGTEGFEHSFSTAMKQIKRKAVL
ncbi:hypothetical protein B0H94_11842 [Salsuginibacillus halophilus]|uniref:Uncharacterized protein n=1 Tax=Salsuginibacillus halophilus TaxID=517424 RepID=A0A2P8H6A2_9BACI|nr:hypothetical protein [Salsuginibacillus halophilus]PSL41729.1 hypothetical protein B0H94_11842 [Salsuginibacillus halophilus]